MHHEFDSLRQLASLNDAELNKAATDEAIAFLSRVVHLLRKEETHSPVLARENFVAIVREMHDLCREGAWQLGQAIIEASELAGNADYAGAIAVYERFLATCESKFHCAIGQKQLGKLKGKASP